MKQKLSFLCAILVLTFALAACSDSNAGTPETPTAPVEAFEGTSEEVLTQVLEAVNLEMMTFEDAVTAENCQGYLGLTAEEFAQYVTDASMSTGAITTNAHQIVVVKANSPEDAVAVKDLIANGFDSGRWICVRPDQSSVVDAGSYVLLVVSKADTVSAALDAWSTLAGEVSGDVNTFFEG